MIYVVFVSTSLDDIPVFASQNRGAAMIVADAVGLEGRAIRNAREVMGRDAARPISVSVARFSNGELMEWIAVRDAQDEEEQRDAS